MGIKALSQLYVGVSPHYNFFFEKIYLLYIFLVSCFGNFPHSPSSNFLLLSPFLTIFNKSVLVMGDIKQMKPVKERERGKCLV